MISPWQVWLADLNPVEGHEQGGTRPTVIISSPFHLGTQRGGVIICPVTNTDRDVRTQVKIGNPRGNHSFVLTEQPRFISTNRFERNRPWWTLTDDEVFQVQRALRLMMDF